MESELEAAAFYDALSDTWATESALREGYLAAIDDVVAEEAKAYSVRSILDVGCGDGQRARSLWQRIGASGVGVDASERMVESARASGVEAHVRDVSQRGGLEGLAAGPFDLVTVLWNVIGHVPGHSARRQAAENIRASLGPRGMAILDVNNRHNAAAYGWRSVARNLLVDGRRGKSAGDYMIERDGASGRVRTTSHLFTLDEITSLCEGAGLAVRRVLFLDYEDGSNARGRFSGQICIVAEAR